MTSFSPLRWASLWICLALWVNLADAQVEFRAIGGPGLEQGKVVVPHAEGAFLVGVSKLPNSDVVRGYIAHFDEAFEHEWSTLLPYGDPIELVVDAWEDEPGVAAVLTQRLDVQDGYQAAIHRVDDSGLWLGSVEPLVQGGFRPARHVEWLGNSWIVGTRSGHPAAYNLDDDEWLEWGDAPGTYDRIHDATVGDNLLIAVGSRTDVDTMHTAIWGVYPLGQLAFEHIEPANDSSLWSQADGIATTPESVLVLQTYAVDNPNGGDPHVVHNFLGVNTNNGDVGAFYGPTTGQRPGRDIASTPQGALILAQSDGNDNPPQGFRLSHVSNLGAFVSLGIWGTDFEDDPGRISVGEDGSVWVAGSTRGTLDGSWNACVLRLDSLGPLGQWYGESPGFGVTSDPLFGTLASVDDEKSWSRWRLSPNPAREGTRLEAQGIEDLAVEWRIVAMDGRECSRGSGLSVPLHGIPAGRHVVEIGSSTRRVALPLIVVD